MKATRWRPGRKTTLKIMTATFRRPGKHLARPMSPERLPTATQRPRRLNPGRKQSRPLKPRLRAAPGMDARYGAAMTSGVTAGKIAAAAGGKTVTTVKIATTEKTVNHAKGA